MERYFLIDFENVHGAGIDGNKKLDESNHIYIFYTENAKNVTLDIFDSNVKADIIVKKVKQGSQSLDKHLISYLGYLIGKNNNKKAKYIIISEDNGYDNIINFWNNETSANITRHKNIKEIIKDIDKTVEKKESDKKQDIKLKKKSDFTILIEEVEYALNRNNHKKKKTVIEDTKKIIKKYYGMERFSNKVHNELRNVYPDQYLDIYILLKPILMKYQDRTIQKESIKSRKMLLNNIIHQKLSKRKIDGDTISSMSSIVVNSIEENNNKQVIYKKIINKYGQKKGLELYNIIKLDI